MNDIDALVAAARAAEQADGGTRYEHEEDEIGTRACCYVLSYKDHELDCYVTKLRAALAQAPTVRVDDAMVERAELARATFWETDSNYPKTEAEFDADPEKYDKLAMRAALEAAIGQGKA